MQYGSEEDTDLERELDEYVQSYSQPWDVHQWKEKEEDQEEKNKS